MCHTNIAQRHTVEGKVCLFVSIIEKARIILTAQRWSKAAKILPQEPRLTDPEPNFPIRQAVFAADKQHRQLYFNACGILLLYVNVQPNAKLWKVYCFRLVRVHTGID